MSTVDCSRYQGVLSVSMLLQWKAAGVTRVILKAGGGDSGRYEDSQWSTNSANVLAAGLILEAYWFNGTTDPVGDAQFLLGYLPAGIRVWGDVENEGSMPHWTDDQADAFERTLIAAAHPTGTYMSASVTFGSWPKCSRRPLWVAGYGFTSVPAVGNWPAPVLWQNTSTGHLPGYAGNLDLDTDLAGLAEAGTVTPITPSNEGFDMPQNWAIGNTRATVGETFGIIWTDPTAFDYQTNMAAWGDPVVKNMTIDELVTVVNEANARGARYSQIGTLAQQLDQNALAATIAAAVAKAAPASGPEVTQADVQNAVAAELKAFFAAAAAS